MCPVRTMRLCQGRSTSLGRPCLGTVVILSMLHALLVTTYHLLARHLDYTEPGADDFDRRHTERATRRAVLASLSNARPEREPGQLGIF